MGGTRKPRAPRAPVGKALKIGISPRFLHKVPPELGFKGKTLQYLESSVAHWLMRAARWCS